jgi:ABC-type transport system involved in cytochrome bd biosynthesis fused ATPase/permease subunit
MKRIRITGRSGIGKSTLLSAMTGVSNYAYNVFIDCEAKTWIEQNVFYASPENIDDEWLVSEFLNAGFSSVHNNRLQNAINDVGLSKIANLLLDRDSDIKFKELSTGERQRVVIVRGILLNRPIWYLDEATANLDPDFEYQVMQVLRSKYNFSIVAITHSDLPGHYFDYVLNMEDIV